MLRRYRLALVALALLGLGASLAALFVHYRLLTDPTYSSFCDINDSVSCQQVFQSAYGSIAGIPVAAGGAIWSSAVLLLAFFGMRQPSSELAGRVAGYIFVLGTVGLAAVLYFAYASFFVLGQACPLCMTMYVSVAGIFLASAAAASSLTAIPSRLGQDVSALTRSQTATTAAVAWLAASVALLVLFPREQVLSADEGMAIERPAEPVLETLTPEQLAEWEAFLDSQPRVAEVMPTGDVKVLVVKFNDYQCPSCRQAWALYGGLLARYETEFPEAFEFVNKDYPLEPECGLASNHMMACEAAAAVRMAQANDKHEELEAWLFSNQSFDMTREQVVEAAARVGQVTDFDARYEQVLQAIREDVALGQKLGVSGTPTFYVNGIKIGTLRPAYFDATIRYALRKAGVTS